MTDEVSLSRYPWCGQEPDIRPQSDLYQVACVSSRCNVLPSVVGKTPADAALFWNRRKM